MSSDTDGAGRDDALYRVPWFITRGDQVTNYAVEVLQVPILSRKDLRPRLRKAAWTGTRSQSLGQLGAYSELIIEDARISAED